MTSEITASKESLAAMEAVAQELVRTCRALRTSQQGAAGPDGDVQVRLDSSDGQASLAAELEATASLLEQGTHAGMYHSVLLSRVTELHQLLAPFRQAQANKKQLLHRQHNATNSPLLDLPEPVLAQIAHATGRTARLSCAQLRDAYGCPTRGLTLTGAEGTPAKTLQAWKWPTQLLHLRMGRPVPVAETAPLLAAIAATLPHLHTLVWHGAGTEAGATAACDHPHPPPLACLTSLSWVHGSPHTLATLRALAPNLRHLTIELRTYMWPDGDTPAPQTAFAAMVARLPHLTSLNLEVCYLHQVPIVHDVTAGLLSAAPRLAALSLLSPVIRPSEDFGALAASLRAGGITATLTALSSLTVNSASGLYALPRWSDGLPRLHTLDLTGYTHATDLLTIIDNIAPTATLARLRLPSIDATHDERLAQWLARTLSCTPALTALRLGCTATPGGPPPTARDHPNTPTWLTPLARLPSLAQLHLSLDVIHAPYLTALHPLGALSYLSLSVESHSPWHQFDAARAAAACAAAFTPLPSVLELRLELCKASAHFAAVRATFLGGALALPCLRVLDLTHFTDLGGAELAALLPAIGAGALHKVRLHERCLGGRDPASRNALQGVLQQLPPRVEVELGRMRALV